MHKKTESDTSRSTYVDPQMAPVIDAMLARVAEREPFGSVSPVVMRRRFNDDIASWNENPPDLPRVVDDQIEGPAGPLQYRLYDPIGDGEAAPCLLHFHGGGWIVGDHLTNDRTLRLLAKKSGVSILSSEYRLAPENKFPDGLNDCVAVTRHVYEQADELGIDNTRIGLSGDSAGGNLALATALQLRNHGDTWLKFLLLVYPALSPNTDTESHRRLGQGDYGLGTAAMEFFWSTYLNKVDDRKNSLAVPLLADFEGLPCTQIISAGLDALHDDAYRLEERLTRADVTNRHDMYPGMVHGFFSMTNFLDVANAAVENVAKVVAERLGSSEFAVRSK